MLRSEGERFNDIGRYATLNKLTMTLVRSVADRLKPAKVPITATPLNVVV